ncbi:peroxiredoxin-like family protein [Emcibacter sp. SYSU 3D8]|uniref:peroxiredoxin-like family protein n=1 Tax=Emcibacter sp. SYSU 3D8 TaxID=3133969 RepID=UPI0031FF28C9
MSLDEQLESIRARAASLPEERRAIMAAATRELIASGIADSALKVGDTVPDFELPNHRGATVKFADLVAQGPVVISFYRGGWCPYCNLEMRALQEKLPEITDLGARLVAVSPELPDTAMSTAEKNAISFDVLSDTGNKVAAAFGLVFTLTPALQDLYRSFGLDLAQFNGDDSMTLPIPATYVVDADRRVLHAFVDPDYTRRLEPDAVVGALRSPS